jgi:hypothetical protein
MKEVNMAKSNIDCRHIKEINCSGFDENRLCPDNCIDFIIKDRIACEVDVDKEQLTEKRSKK